MTISRQIRLNVMNAYSTSSNKITQELARARVWVTNRMSRVSVCARRLTRGTWEWLKSHATRIALILSILFVVLVAITVTCLIVAAFLFPLTSEYTLTARYSYIFRAIAVLIAPIVVFLTSGRQWVRAAITIAIELYLGSLMLDLINIATK